MKKEARDAAVYQLAMLAATINPQTACLKPREAIEQAIDLLDAAADKVDETICPPPQ